MRESLNRRGVPISGILLVAALLLVWEGSVRLGFVQSGNWPAFSAVVASLVHGIASGELLPIIGSTLWRMLQGYVLGSAVGIGIGLLLALNGSIRRTLEPAVELARPIPIIAVIPPLIFLLGLDDPLKIFCVAVSVFFPVALNTIAGVAGVDPTYRQVAQTFGLPPSLTLRRVIIPAALPFILAGLRTSLAIALIVAVLAEMIAGQQGIGYYLMSMQFAMRGADMYSAIVLLTIVAYGLNYAFVAWEARVIRWARLNETLGDAA
jgi:ABC-type nitrate/sulfonate/bicarbonate transport system permease component